MRLSTKLTAGFALACLIVLGGYGAFELRGERKDLLSATDREMRLVGNAVAVAVSHALRDHRTEDLQGILDAIEFTRSDVDIFVFGPDNELVASSFGAQENLPLVPPLVEIAHASRQGIVRFEGGPSDLSFLKLALPLVSNDVSLGTLVLIRPLDDVRKDLAATRESLVVTIATLIVTISGLGLLLGIVYVRRPLTAIAHVMRVVQRGDLSARLTSQSSEELDDLVAEFNAMVAALREARERFATEAETRQALEEGLRRVDKLATVGQLSAGLAHEIGSPLQILNGRARSLLARPHSPEDVRRNAEILVAESERIAGIVEQLLRYSRRIPVKLVEIDLLPTAQVVVDLLELVVRRQGIQLELAVGPSLPKVIADPNQLQQVLLNLLSNAIKATSRGGTVTLRIHPLAADAAAFVEVIVEDSGTGMPPEVLAHAFEPFFTTTAEGGGTGLGLAVVKAIVTEHGGTIRAISALGVGSQFVIQLPVQGPNWRQARPT